MSGLVTLQNVYTPSAAARSPLAIVVDSGLSFSEYLDGLVERVDNDSMAERIVDNLAAAGILESEEDDEEEDEAVDELLKAIKARQEALMEEVTGKKKTGFTVEEVKEVLAGLHGVSSKTA